MESEGLRWMGRNVDILLVPTTSSTVGFPAQIVDIETQMRQHVVTIPNENRASSQFLQRVFFLNAGERCSHGSCPGSRSSPSRKKSRQQSLQNRRAMALILRFSTNPVEVRSGGYPNGYNQSSIRGASFLRLYKCADTFRIAFPYSRQTKTFKNKSKNKRRVEPRALTCDGILDKGNQH